MMRAFMESIADRRVRFLMRTELRSKLSAVRRHGSAGRLASAKARTLAIHPSRIRARGAYASGPGDAKGSRKRSMPRCAAASPSLSMPALSLWRTGSRTASYFRTAGPLCALPLAYGEQSKPPSNMTEQTTLHTISSFRSLRGSICLDMSCPAPRKIAGDSSGSYVLDELRYIMLLVDECISGRDALLDECRAAGQK